MARSTLTTTIRRIQGLADQVLGLPLEEYHYFLDLIDPQPEPEPPAKKTRKKRGPRTPRAESLSNAIAKTPKSETGAPVLCVAQVPGLNVECGNTEDNGIHDPKGGYGGYHEFVAPKSKKAAK